MNFEDPHPCRGETRDGIEDPNQTNFIEDMFQDASCYATKSSEKNSFDVVEKDSNEESVVKIEKPNNIILPDNN